MNKELIKWSEQFKQLPWRKKRTLYSTLVSEIMLQQTTVGTVLNHFDKFMNEYPTIFKLAEASEEQLTISWKGLGYYRRARNLKKACEFIVEEFQGEIPLDYDLLITIPGIGPYTASAIIAIGANKPALAVDANLERVLARFYALDARKGPSLQKAIYQRFQEEQIANEIHTLGPRKLNEALMDLGRNICKSKRASCELCPLSSNCQAANLNKALEYPKQNAKSKKAYSFELELVRLIVKKNNQILVYQKNEKEWLSGQWETPTFILKSQDKDLKQYPLLKKKISLKKSKSVKTGITKYKITNHVIEMSYAEFQKNFKSSKYQFKTMSSKSNLSSSLAKFI